MIPADALGWPSYSVQFIAANDANDATTLCVGVTATPWFAFFAFFQLTYLYSGDGAFESNWDFDPEADTWRFAKGNTLGV